MFSPEIVNSDVFLEMPPSTQALYFQLGMKADDDGFVSPKMVMRTIGSTDDELRVLVGKRFVIPFENGVLVIKHWRMNNFIRKDRYKPTPYLDEKNKLFVKENGAYTLDEKQGIPIAASEWKTDEQCRISAGQPMVDHRLTQDRLGEDRIGKDTGDTVRTAPTVRPKRVHSNFTKPSIEEVRAYCAERKNSVDCNRFVDYYESNGWRVGRNPMKDWRASVRTWERSSFPQRGGAAGQRPQNAIVTEHTSKLVEVLERRAARNKGE